MFVIKKKMKMKKILKPRNLLCFFPGTLQSIEKLKILENHTCSKKKIVLSNIYSKCKKEDERRRNKNKLRY